MIPRHALTWSATIVWIAAIGVFIVAAAMWLRPAPPPEEEAAIVSEQAVNDFEQWACDLSIRAGGYEPEQADCYCRAPATRDSLVVCLGMSVDDAEAALRLSARLPGADEVYRGMLAGLGDTAEIDCLRRMGPSEEALRRCLKLSDAEIAELKQGIERLLLEDLPKRLQQAVDDAINGAPQR